MSFDLQLFDFHFGDHYYADPMIMIENKSENDDVDVDIRDYCLHFQSKGK